MEFDELVKILRGEWTTVKHRRGYMIVSVAQRNRTQLYDNKNLDALMSTLPRTRVDSICSESLYIESRKIRRISIMVERSGEFYKCTLRKYV